MHFGTIGRCEQDPDPVAGPAKLSRLAAGSAVEEVDHAPGDIQARKAEMDPVRELPYWPAAKALHIEAGQMAASDYVPTYPNLALASERAFTDANRPT